MQGLSLTDYSEPSTAIMVEPTTYYSTTSTSSAGPSANNSFPPSLAALAGPSGYSCCSWTDYAAIATLSITPTTTDTIAFDYIDHSRYSTATTALNYTRSYPRPNSE